MIINDKGFVIFHIPKTGGTSVRGFFKDCEGNRADLVQDQHEQPKALFERLPDLRSYAAYVFIRNPWERMESAFRHQKRYHNRAADWMFSDFVEQLTVKNTFPQTTLTNSVMLPQHLWCSKGPYPLRLPFDDLATECKHIAKAFDLEVPEEFPHQHATQGEVYWTKKALQTFNQLYSKDIDLVGQGFGGELK